MLGLMVNTSRTGRGTRPASIGAAIKARRAFLGLSAEDVYERSGGVISLKLLSKLENNHTSPGGLKLGRYRMLLHALQLSPAEFEALTGVPASAAEPEELPGSREYEPSLRVPVLGTVSAGLREVRVIDAEDHMLLDPSLPGLRGRPSANLVALRVNGDSMVSEGARGNIRPGWHVIVELGAVPQNGDTVVGWLPEHDAAVVKQYREEPDTILRSVNPAGPVFRLADTEVDIRGVVRMVIGSL